MFKERRLEGRVSVNLGLLKLTPSEFNSLVTQCELFQQKNIHGKYFGSGGAMRHLANQRGVDKCFQANRLPNLFRVTNKL